MHTRTTARGIGLFTTGLLAIVLMTAGCGGGTNTPDDDNGNGDLAAALAACNRYVDHLAGLSCRNPDFPLPTCEGIDRIPVEEVPDYDCLVENVVCASDDTLDDSGTAGCF